MYTGAALFNAYILGIISGAIITWIIFYNNRGGKKK